MQIRWERKKFDSRLRIWSSILCTFTLKEAVISNNCCSAVSFSVYRTIVRPNVSKLFFCRQVEWAWLINSIFCHHPGRNYVFFFIFILFFSEMFLRVNGFQDGWNDPTNCLMCCSRKQKFPLVSSDENVDSLFPGSLIPGLLSSKEISAFCVIFKTGRNAFSLFLTLSLKAKLERTF